MIQAECVHSHSSVWLQLLLSSNIFPVVKYITSEVIIADGVDLEQWQIHLGVVWNWLCQIQGKFLAASHISHPHSPLLKTITLIFLLSSLLPLRRIRFQVKPSEKNVKLVWLGLQATIPRGFSRSDMSLW